MARSDDSDSSTHRKKSKKKKSRRSSLSKSRGDRRSRSRDRKSKSRDRRSRSRDKRSRSRDKRSRTYDRRSRSRDTRRSRSRDRRSRSRDRRSRSRDKRSRSRDRKSRDKHSRDQSSESRDKRRSSIDKNGDSNIEPVILSTDDIVKRTQAIEDIESESFVQQDFKSSAVTNIALPGEEKVDKFEFGTSAEVKSKGKDQPVDPGGDIFHPALFGDQAAREKRFLVHIFTIRQRAKKAMAAAD